MLGLGFTLAWFGYSLVYWGVGYVSGHPKGLITVIWRDRTTAPAKAKAKAK